MLSMWLRLRVYAYAYLVQEYGNTRRRSECDHEIRQILTLIGLESRFGDKLLRIRVLCPQNGTAVLKGLTKCGNVRSIMVLVAAIVPVLLAV